MVGWSPLRTRPVRKVHIYEWSDKMDSLNYERRERIVTPDFELAFSYGNRALVRWEAAYISAVVASTLKDVYDCNINRDIRRTFEKLSKVVHESEVKDND